MRKIRIALNALLLATALGCEPQPPESCDTIPDQTLHVRQLERLTPCFADPDGDRLTLAAVTAAMRGLRLWLSGRTPGPTGDAPEATDWRIMASMATADSLGVATVKWQAAGSEYIGYYLSVGRTAVDDSANWEFGVCFPQGGPCENPGWENQYGWSYEIEVGMLQEFHIWMEEDRTYVRIGEDGPWLMNGVRPGSPSDGVSTKLHGRLELGMFDDDRQGLTAVYDWVELVVKCHSSAFAAHAPAYARASM